MSIEILDTASDMERGKALFLEVEASGWKAAEGTAMNADEATRSLFTEIVDNLSGSRRCRIAVLSAMKSPLPP